MRQQTSWRGQTSVGLVWVRGSSGSRYTAAWPGPVLGGPPPTPLESSPSLAYGAVLEWPLGGNTLVSSNLTDSAWVPYDDHPGVLDTSVFIAEERRRPLDEDRLPDEAAISVVTLAELHAGVLAAKDTDTRAVRLATLDAPIDEQVALTWARMRVHLAEAGRRVNVNDLWIAASAATHGLPVVTQDDDLELLTGVAGLRIVRV